MRYVVEVLNRERWQPLERFTDETAASVAFNRELDKGHAVRVMDGDTQVMLYRPGR